jgi:hypothetical protein
MVDGVLGVETDGAGFHSAGPEFEEDRRRWNVATRSGLPVVIATYSMVVQRPQEFLALIRDTMDMLSVRPRPGT